MKYGPYICIGVVLSILFVLWAFWGGKNYEFVGLAPLSPETCGSYTGSLYNWGNITPATGYDPVEGHDCVPPDTACTQEINDPVCQSSQRQTIIDNTPLIPPQFTNPNNQSHLNGPERLDSSNPNNSFEMNSASNIESDKNICHQSQEEIPLILDYNPRRNTSTPQEFKQMGLPQPINPVNYIQPQRGRFISRGERMCCQTMERIYGVPFNTIRPDWLRNPETGERLELDCYNDDLKIAVEYNGEQHYKWPNFTNQTYEQFINQTRRDTLKADLCDRNGVYLIVVPCHVLYENIPSYIMSYLPETLQQRIQEEQTFSTIIS
jgi:hypothetical protein